MTDPRDEGLPLPRYVPGADQRANLREVAPGLYVGGMIAVCERPTQTRDWWAVVDCHGYRVDGQREVRFGTLPRVVRYGFDDCGPVPASLLAAASALYRERGGDVLVCCAAGSSRSAAVAYAMMRDVLGAPHDDALARVSQRGGGPHPATLASAKAWVMRKEFSQCEELRATVAAQKLDNESLRDDLRRHMDAAALHREERRLTATEGEEMRDRLLNLLARIHRDGGHYTEANGVEKASEDADVIVAELFGARSAIAHHYEAEVRRIAERVGGVNLGAPINTVGRMAWHVIHLREGFAAIAPRCQCGQIALHESVVIGGVAPLRVCDGAVCLAVARAAGVELREMPHAMVVRASKGTVR